MDQVSSALWNIPLTFGLRAFPGTFRVCRGKSYFDGNRVQLVVQVAQMRNMESLWVDFSRCTVDELRREIR